MKPAGDFIAVFKGWTIKSVETPELSAGINSVSAWLPDHLQRGPGRFFADGIGVEMIFEGQPPQVYFLYPGKHILAWVERDEP